MQHPVYYNRIKTTPTLSFYIEFANSYNQLQYNMNIGLPCKFIVAGLPCKQILNIALQVALQIAALHAGIAQRYNHFQKNQTKEMRLPYILYSNSVLIIYCCMFSTAKKQCFVDEIKRCSVLAVILFQWPVSVSSARLIFWQMFRLPCNMYILYISIVVARNPDRVFKNKYLSDH